MLHNFVISANIFIQPGISLAANVKQLNSAKYTRTNKIQRFFQKGNLLVNVKANVGFEMSYVNTQSQRSLKSIRKRLRFDSRYVDTCM